MQVVYRFAVLLVEFDGPGAFALFERRFVAREDVEQPFGRLVARGGLLAHLADAALDRFEVLELEFRVDDLLVAHRVDRSVHMRDVVVLEAAQHVDDRVRLADVGQKLVAQPLAFGRALDQTGYIDDLDRRGDDFLRVVYFREVHDPLVGHRDDPDVGFYRTERKIRRLRLGVRQTVEQRRLAYVGQAYDSAL